MEESDARDKVDKGAKIGPIKDRECANEQIVEGKSSIYHLLLSPSVKFISRRLTASELLTMLMDRPYEIPNSAEHFRDMITDWEGEHIDISHGENYENEQEKAGETSGNEDITK